MGLCPKPHILSWLLHLLFYFKGIQRPHSTSCSSVDTRKDAKKLSELSEATSRTHHTIKQCVNKSRQNDAAHTKTRLTSPFCPSVHASRTALKGIIKK